MPVEKGRGLNLSSYWYLGGIFCRPAGEVARALAHLEVFTPEVWFLILCACFGACPQCCICRTFVLTGFSPCLFCSQTFFLLLSSSFLFLKETLTGLCFLLHRLAEFCIELRNTSLRKKTVKTAQKRAKMASKRAQKDFRLPTFHQVCLFGATRVLNHCQNAVILPNHSLFGCDHLLPHFFFFFACVRARPECEWRYPESRKSVDFVVCVLFACLCSLVLLQ